jgi:hypothetical protein
MGQRIVGDCHGCRCGFFQYCMVLLLNAWIKGVAKYFKNKAVF